MSIVTMLTGSVFENNRTQAVRLPAESRFPPSVRKVVVIVRGAERILTPIDKVWDSFFLSDLRASDDFLPERADQHQSEREAF